MNLDRRHFLRLGMATAGAAAVAAAGFETATAAQTPAPGNSGAAGGVSGGNAGGKTMKVMTTDGQLLEVPAGQARQIKLPVLSSADIRQGIPGRRFVMMIDLAKCDGCGQCTKSCGQMHFIPPDRQWIRVFQMQDSPATAPYYMPRPCFHCDNPPCTKVCPVGATFKREDGIVLIDNERCIGCRFCMAACPFNARCFNWGPPNDPPAALAEGYSPEHGFPRRIGTAEKCDFCPDMARQGKLPDCSSGCPMGAIYYGDQNEDAVTNSQGETLRFSQTLRDRAAFRYREDLGTQPRVYYLPPVNRQYPGPDLHSKKGDQA